MDEQAQLYIDEIKDALIPLKGRITRMASDLEFYKNPGLMSCSYHPHIRWDGTITSEECPLCQLKEARESQQDALQRAAASAVKQREITRRCDAITGLEPDDRDKFGAGGALWYVERHVEQLERIRFLSERFLKLRAKRNIGNTDSEEAFHDALAELVYALER